PVHREQQHPDAAVAPAFLRFEQPRPPAGLFVSEPSSNVGRGPAVDLCGCSRRRAARFRPGGSGRACSRSRRPRVASCCSPAPRPDRLRPAAPDLLERPPRPARRRGLPALSAGRGGCGAGRRLCPRPAGSERLRADRALLRRDRSASEAARRLGGFRRRGRVRGAFRRDLPRGRRGSGAVPGGRHADEARGLTGLRFLFGLALLPALGWPFARLCAGEARPLARAAAVPLGALLLGGEMALASAAGVSWDAALLLAPALAGWAVLFLGRLERGPVVPRVWRGLPGAAAL